jgi:hypothetical protein
MKRSMSANNRVADTLEKTRLANNSIRIDRVRGPYKGVGDTLVQWIDHDDQRTTIYTSPRTHAQFGTERDTSGRGR